MTSRKANTRAEYSGEHLVDLDRFIQATRDSGYKGTGSAVAELVDNARQAGATRIDVWVDTEWGYPTVRSAKHVV
jgi:hypothetical protein